MGHVVSMDVLKVVKKRLLIMNAVIFLTAFIGIYSIFEIDRGVLFHELNLYHMKYTQQFTIDIDSADLESKESISNLLGVLHKIRDQPIACLENQNFIVTYATKFLGTYGAFRLCEYDIVVADKAISIIKQLQDGQITVEEAFPEIEKASLQFAENSSLFFPLISKTVDALLIFMFIIMVVKGLASSLVSYLASRSILLQFEKNKKIEEELSSKNEALGQSIDRLQKQKTEIDEAKEEAIYHSLHDPLTQLPNRRYLDEKIEELKASQGRSGLFHIDLDFFKDINDSLGHDAGDFVLLHVAKVLSSLVRKDDFVARVGGDEFVILTPLAATVSDEEHAERLAERLLKKVSEGLFYEGEFCRLSFSIGVAFQKRAGEGLRALLIDADMALYKAKSQGRNCFVIFNEGLKSAHNKRKTLIDDLSIALENEEIFPVYQPQFETVSLELSGMEALARWNHPERGMISPAEFLPIAKEMGILGDIDRRILKCVASDLSELDKLNIFVPKVSVNISAQRLLEPGLIDDLKFMRLPSNRIVFELLESIFLDNTEDQIRWTLDALNDLGIALEIDDFGSGHASILGLLGIRPKGFKIDGQLIKHIDCQESARSLVRSIIEIGRSLNMKVVAEGVETKDHVKVLQNMGCDYLQGYALAKPMTKKDIIRFLSQKFQRKQA